ncbi:MAG: hypothetical protein K0S16_2008 [Moraxellaceae bacterium]|nr:hypothetical protein [Moraxellaceae bacterium]
MPSLRRWLTHSALLLASAAFAGETVTEVIYSTRAAEL